MSASRNLGISCASGEFIAFLDADDVWLPHKLEQQVEIMHSRPDASMIYGLTEYWYSWTEEIDDRQKDFVEDPGIEPGTLVRPPNLLCLLLESKAPTPGTSDIMLRRELLDCTGWFEDSFRGMFEDQAFLSKVYIQAPVLVTGEKWFRYRQHTNSCVALSAASNQKRRAGLAFFAWLEQYLIKECVTDPRVWRALKKKRRRYRYPKLHRIWTEAAAQLEALSQRVQRVVRQSMPASVRRWLLAHFGQYRSNR